MKRFLTAYPGRTNLSSNRVTGNLGNNNQVWGWVSSCALRINRACQNTFLSTRFFLVSVFVVFTPTAFPFSQLGFNNGREGRVPVRFLGPGRLIRCPLVPLLSRGKRRASLGCSQSEPTTGRAPPAHAGAGLPDRPGPGPHRDGVSRRAPARRRVEEPRSAPGPRLTPLGVRLGSPRHSCEAAATRFPSRFRLPSPGTQSVA